MTSTIPVGLSYADIGRFAMRAAQFEKTNPVIAYWCNFHIVNQIVGQGLHNSDDQIKIYTTNLVDKLEQFKSQNFNDETVMDSVAASAMVEHFGLGVFTRAEAAMNANKATKQTADSFQGASLFLELCQIWGALSPDIARRIKFGNYHAVRIVRAIKNGEDPNATNPVPKEEEQESFATQEVHIFDESVAEQASRTRLPPFEEVPEESNRPGRQLAKQSSLDESLHLSQPSSLPRLLANSAPDISSVLCNAPATPARTKDNDNPQPEGLERPSAPVRNEGLSVTVPAPASFYGLSGAKAHTPDPADLQSGPPLISRAHVAPALAAPLNQPLQSADDLSIALAQKHAHWALSALTFEDVDTAVKEFKNSLRHLGAAY